MRRSQLIAIGEKSAPETGPLLHGGAERLKTRLCNADVLPTKISWYRIAPGQKCSAHVHAGKDECWLIVAGTGSALVGDSHFSVMPGDFLLTPEGVPHSLANTGSDALVFVNIVFPTGAARISTTEIGNLPPP